MRMPNDVQDAAAFQAGRGILVDELNRHIDVDPRRTAHTHEIDMRRKIANGIDLDLARDNALLLAVDVEQIDRRKEMPGLIVLQHILVFQRHICRRGLAAVNDAGDLFFAP